MKMEEMRILIGATTLAKRRNGNYLARWSFFYTHGQTAETKAEIVTKKIPEAVVVDHTYVWKTFKGGASVANQSHFAVEFKIVEETEEEARNKANMEHEEELKGLQEEIKLAAKRITPEEKEEIKERIAAYIKKSGYTEDDYERKNG
jgi:hypothetical protein